MRIGTARTPRRRCGGVSCPVGRGRPGVLTPPSAFHVLHSYESTDDNGGARKKRASSPRSACGWSIAFRDDDSRRFNAVARLAGTAPILASGMPDRDRPRGGRRPYGLPFDQELIAAYARLLARTFSAGRSTGVCNTHNDWGRFTKATQFETQRSARRSSRFSPGTTPPMLEYARWTTTPPRTPAHAPPVVGRVKGRYAPRAHASAIAGRMPRARPRGLDMAHPLQVRGGCAWPGGRVACRNRRSPSPPAGAAKAPQALGCFAPWGRAAAPLCSRGGLDLAVPASNW